MGQFCENASTYSIVTTTPKYRETIELFYSSINVNCIDDITIKAAFVINVVVFQQLHVVFHSLS